MSSRPDLVRAFLLLRNERRTGVATVTMPLPGKAQGEQTFVYLSAGVPVFAEAGSNGETLGRLLVRKGALTQEQYVEILGKMTDALVLNEQVRFGEVAVELGHMTQAAVNKALGDQVRAKIVRLFLASTPTWSFEDSEARLDDVGRFPVSIDAAVLEAMRWLDDDAKLESGLGRAKTTVMAPTAPLAELVSRFELGPDETAFLRTIDGRRTGDALLATPEARAVDAPALLLALALTRAVREPSVSGKLSPLTAGAAFQPSGAGLPGQMPAVMPRPNPAAAASAPAVSSAPRGAVPAGGSASPPPSAAAPRAPGTLGTTGTVPMGFTPAGAPGAPRKPTPAPEGMARLQATRASDILRALEQNKVKHDAKKTPESAHEAKLMAESAFQSGVTAMKQGRWAQAAPDLARASQLRPDSEEYRLYAKWAQINARSNEPPHPLERSELGRIATVAVKADPQFAFGYYIAGYMAFLGDEVDKAEKLLQRAAKLDPSILDAQRLVRLLQRRKGGSGSGGGFLSKKLW